jgi:thymidylate synthase
MHVLTVQNVNDALLKGMTLLATQRESGLRETRNGPAYVFPEPVTTHYRYPTQRVLFSPERDANPFFHLLEALWMLGGQRDVKRMAWLVPRMAQYSDDGETFHAAYGYRWRHWRADIDTREDEYEEYDQIIGVVTELQINPRSRRAIIQMWDPVHDMGKPPIPAKDLPCNTTIKFSIDYREPSSADPRVSMLNMIVFNRSNDIIMGAYGANAVHLSVLQEYVAAMLGVRVGWYEQVSCDYHAYKEEFDRLWKDTQFVAASEPPMRIDPYARFGAPESSVMVKSLVDDPTTFDEALEQFLAAWERESWEDMAEFQSSSQFIDHVAHPMLWAYHLYRDLNDPRGAYAWLDNNMEDEGRVDWLIAGRDWMRRRVIARSRKEPETEALIKGGWL